MDIYLDGAKIIRSLLKQIGDWNDVMVNENIYPRELKRQQMVIDKLKETISKIPKEERGHHD